MALRIVFMGTPDFAVPVLEAVLAAGHRVAAVYTQPPRPAGRGMADTMSPVQRFAQARGMTVLTPKNFKHEVDRAAFAAHAADAVIVVAYGLLLPKQILSAPRLGCFNLHASKLPRWRGAAPIQRAIMAGDTETAVMVMRMEEGLDTGPICLSRDVAIGPETTAGELHDTLAAAGAPLMAEALSRLETGTLTETPQAKHGVTYAAKIGKDETRIDFGKPAGEVAACIRGLSPFPGAWLALRTPAGEERLKVLNAIAVEARAEMPAKRPGEVLDGFLTVACAQGAIRLTRLQRAGKKAVAADEFLRGFKVAEGEVLGR